LQRGGDLVTQVAVVGAGVSGLVCARALAAAGLDVVLVESSDRAGGRVGTDVVNGFLLDRGFQVFLDAYPAAARELDLAALDLRAFLPGALVHTPEEGSAWARVSDPLRRPQDLVAALVAPVGTLLDKAKVGVYRLATLAWTLGDVFEHPETSTLEHLSVTLGLSDSMIDRFFRPFYQGIFLAPLEEQSSRMFEFVFYIFAIGRANLPANGMQVNLGFFSVDFRGFKHNFSLRPFRTSSLRIFLAIACRRTSATRMGGAEGSY
jgi:uncharacterized protein with NAD-binding domain and iron-sulfur cluster